MPSGECFYAWHISKRRLSTITCLFVDITKWRKKNEDGKLIYLTQVLVNISMCVQCLETCSFDVTHFKHIRWPAENWNTVAFKQNCTAYHNNEYAKMIFTGLLTKKATPQSKKKKKEIQSLESSANHWKSNRKCTQPSPNPSTKSNFA